MTDKITWEMFRDYHYAVGEDFFDQTGEGNHLIFGGYLLAKYPEYSKEILAICNSEFGECQSYRDEIEPLGYDEEKDIDYLYVEFAEFCNLTESLKGRVLDILNNIAGEDE